VVFVCNVLVGEIEWSPFKVYSGIALQWDMA